MTRWECRKQGVGRDGRRRRWRRMGQMESREHPLRMRMKVKGEKRVENLSSHGCCFRGGDGRDRNFRN